MLKVLKEQLLSIPIQRSLMLFLTVTVSAFFLASSSYLNNSVETLIDESETYHSDVLFAEVIAPKVTMWNFLSGTDTAMFEAQLKAIMDAQKLSYIAFTSSEANTTITVSAPGYRADDSHLIRHTRAIADPTHAQNVIGFLEVAYVNTHLEKLQQKYRLFLLILAPLLALLFYLEWLLLRNLLTPLRKIADAIKSYQPGDRLDLHRYLRSKNDEIYEIAGGFRQMQQNIDQALAAREEEMERSKAKDRILMRQSRFVEMGTMIQNIAHQWKQPLNIIELAITDLTLRQLTGNLTPQRQSDTYEEIHRQVSYMSRTIDTFKSFLEEDGETAVSVAFSVKEAVDTALILVGSTFKKENIALDNALDERCFACGDPKEFEQAVLSIVHNAVDAIRMHPSERNVIRIRCRVDGEQNVITIEDTGGGFDPDLTETMFDAYVTTKHMSQGTGLGLFIARTLVALKMHGHIEAENIKGGARFTIFLPFCDSSDRT